MTCQRRGCALNSPCLLTSQMRCCHARGQEMAETVGPPMPGTAFRLEAVPEMNYSPSETFHPTTPAHTY